MRLSIVISGFVALVGLRCTSAPTAIRDIAGCYSLSRGPWQLDPRSSHPTDPPDTIQLSTRPARGRDATLYSVSPHAFDTAARGAASFWWRHGDSVFVDWSVAFATVAIRATPTDSGLTGIVEYRNDVVLVVNGRQVPWPTASIHLRRSGCAAAA
jgi:hypothetical protein